MKKIIALSLLAFVVLTANAQLPVNPGLKIGYSGSKISTNVSDITSDLRNGFLGGAFLRVNLKKWHVQPEVYFAMKGGELTYDLEKVYPNDPNPAQAVSQTVKLQTIDVPLLLGYKLFNPPMMNFRIHGGPVASFVLNKDISITKDGVDFKDENIKDALKNAIWGIQAGGGVDVFVFTLDVRYEIGLNNFYEKPANDLGKLEEFKSSALLISLGWKLIP